MRPVCVHACMCLCAHMLGMGGAAHLCCCAAVAELGAAIRPEADQWPQEAVCLTLVHGPHT